MSNGARERVETGGVDLAYTLDDRYTRETGRVYLDGDQALVRVLLMQRQRDVSAGLNTAGYVSGYRGSPLGVLDMAMWKAEEHLKRHHVRFQPGVNEELAATAVWGTQQLKMMVGSRYDGVFGMWYGKGPGVDRAGDALKTANHHGTDPNGGVLVLCGDDHGARSSSLAHQSEQALISFGMPILNPSSVQDYIDLGLYGYALSRFSGCYVGFICVTDTVETAASVAIDRERVSVVLPEVERPPQGLNIARVGLVDMERALFDFRLPAASAFAQANGLDRVVLGDDTARIGIVTCGKAYNDVRQALTSLGVDDERARALGIAVYKVALTWPLDPVGARAFARGKTDLLIVEEKRPLLEQQLTTLMYGQADAPRIAGKRDWEGNLLVPNFGELTGQGVASVITRWVQHVTGEELKPVGHRVLQLTEAGAASDIVRTPAFCSGCPHNVSTNIPDDSIAYGGIGCHGMAGFLPERRTIGSTQMGGEGANWIGQYHFTDRDHIFQNLGDGTYFHSGLLAIRAAKAADVNITYKILANAAVAMTGGQPVEGDLTVPDIARQVAAEGIDTIRVVTDDPAKYSKKDEFPSHVTFHHRREMDDLQRELREQPGVTVLIYDQACAAENRRMRKRHQLIDPAKRIVINELVCEGCGDCNVQSNCISVEPLDTEFGRKRKINQSSCNKDYSCVEGYCPSFVTVLGGELRDATSGVDPIDIATLTDELPPPVSASGDRCSVLVTGIGGSGIVTLGAILAVAGHLEGRGVSVLNVLGMAQKNGAVASHIRFSAGPDDVASARIGPGDADLIVATDPVVTAAADIMATIAKGRTNVVLNSHVAPTVEFSRRPDLQFDADPILRALQRACDADRVVELPATRWSTRLFGDAITANMMMLGFACQSGQLPVGPVSLMRAIELNGQAVKANQDAFMWGRLAAHDRSRVVAVADAERTVAQEAADVVDAGTLEAIVERRAAFLVDYQDKAYAKRYRDFVSMVANRQAAVDGGDDLARAVARYYFQLLAYKDEYEVARLYTDGSFRRQVGEEFSGDYKLELNLAPQLFNRRHPRTGRAKKHAFGPWIFPALGVLAKGKRIRGTSLDVFGKTAHRRQERELIREYETTIREMLPLLRPENGAVAVELASVPEHIRGFDTIKDNSIAAARAETERLLDQLRSSEREPAA
jgi:indolepyruvate ferredoxin oxidoreductase